MARLKDVRDEVTFIPVTWKTPVDWGRQYAAFSVDNKGLLYFISNGNLCNTIRGVCKHSINAENNMILLAGNETTPEEYISKWRKELKRPYLLDIFLGEIVKDFEWVISVGEEVPQNKLDKVKGILEPVGNNGFSARLQGAVSEIPQKLTAWMSLADKHQPVTTPRGVLECRII